MATRPHHLLWLAAGAAALIANSASADPAPPNRASGQHVEAHEPPRMALPPVTHGCTKAAIADLVVSHNASVDEVRVVLDQRSPVGGAAAVTVQAGEFDRALTVFGQSRALQFRPALSGSTFRVTLDPVFAAGAGACINRIELRSAGRPVATVRP